MGQHISHCNAGTEASYIPKSFKMLLHDDNMVSTMSRTTASTGYYSKSSRTTASTGNSSKSSVTTASTGNFSKSTSRSTTTPSPGSSSPSISTTALATNINNGSASCDHNHAHQYQRQSSHQSSALRYTTSTRNLRNQRTTQLLLPSRDSDPSLHLTQEQYGYFYQDDEEYEQEEQSMQQMLLQAAAAADKRSTPVKFPRRRHSCAGAPGAEQQNNTNDPRHTNTSAAGHHAAQTAQNPSYLERMYDSRTWEMYRRITTHREKVEAFNANPANIAAAAAAAAAVNNNNIDDDRNSANQTTMSEPVQRVTSASTMMGGTDCGDDECEGGIYPEDHSAPSYHPHHHTHHGGGGGHNGCSYKNCNENYSEWEHMNGDVVDGEESSIINAMHGGAPQHETVFLFEF